MNAPYRLESTWVFIGLRCILKACPSCGNPVPINGLLHAVQCPSCLSHVALPAALWFQMLDLPLEELLNTGEIAPKSMSVADDAGRLSVSVDRFAMPSPVCVHCATPLTCPRQAIGRQAFSLTCAACGKSSDFAPPQLTLPTLHQALVHVVGAERDGSVAAGAVPAAGVTRSAPVVMTCPRCTAALEIDEKSKRTVPCTYCGAAVYLPEDLWRQIHPVKTSTLWTVVLRLLPAELTRAEIKVFRTSVRGMISLYVLLAFVPFMFFIVGAAIGDMDSVLFGAPSLALLTVVFSVIVGRGYSRSLSRRETAKRLEAAVPQC